MTRLKSIQPQEIKIGDVVTNYDKTIIWILLNKEFVRNKYVFYFLTENGMKKTSLAHKLPMKVIK